MYTKDKTQRITLRLNEEQFAFVATICDALGVSPSEYLRMMINLAISSAKKANSSMELAQSTVEFIDERMRRNVSTNNNTQEVSRRENEQTNIDNIV